MEADPVSPSTNVVPLIPATAWLMSTSIVPLLAIFLTLTQMLPRTSPIFESWLGGELQTISDSGFSRNVDRSAHPMIAVLSSAVFT